MQLFELLTFTVRVRTVATAMACLEQRLAERLPGVALMGCWASEIGPLNQIAVLRGFADEATRQAERERYLLSADAFGIETYLTDMRAENYTLFPFLEPLAAGAHGPFYELRVYDLVPFGWRRPSRAGKKPWARARRRISRRSMPPSMPPTGNCPVICISGPTPRWSSAWRCALVR